ncbi:PepSY domain-containing protein [Streptomyces cadmiisoli]|uniref:PepSY domain-containing protein n=1 Tax=Streptomyces cadmiisoli TaxID=2184053 RepID=UPI00364C52DF
MSTKRNILVAALTAATVIGGGTALAVTSGSTGGGSSATPTAPASVTVDGTGGRGDDDRDARGDDAGRGTVTAVQAIDAALKAAPGTVVSVDLDRDDDRDDDGDDGGRRAWEVAFLDRGTTARVVNVDASNGRVLGTRAGDDDDVDGDDRAAAGDAAVTAREAVQAASAKGFVTSIDLDDDDRSVSWDVEAIDSAGVERDWNVDLRTAAVTADPRDDATDDRGRDDDRDDRSDDDGTDDRGDDRRDDDSRADDRRGDDDHDDDRGRDDDRHDDKHDKHDNDDRDDRNDDRDDD